MLGDEQRHRAAALGGLARGVQPVAGDVRAHHQRRAPRRRARRRSTPPPPSGPRCRRSTRAGCRRCAWPRQLQAGPGRATPRAWSGPRPSRCPPPACRRWDVSTPCAPHAAGPPPWPPAPPSPRPDPPPPSPARPGPRCTSRGPRRAPAPGPRCPRTGGAPPRPALRFQPASSWGSFKVCGALASSRCAQCLGRHQHQPARHLAVLQPEVRAARPPPAAAPRRRRSASSPRP